MSTFSIMLADETTEAVYSAWQIAGPGTRNAFVIFGSMALVTALVLLWAIFLRKRRRHRRSHHHSHEHAAEPAGSRQLPVEEGASLPLQHHRRRRRPRRRRHSRNPTLAETGGLPPIRPANSPEPQP
ncbi:MAG TPA: hypothetical protein P5205_10555 [Candidatus Paceibacterota bacterium]|nr:hypothetical protein [Verrucomicrobiota bacterium]HSA10796.1 hypothetical protein [Candidatus Paceibacterota bacterium]